MLLGKLIKNIKPAYKSIKFNNIRFNSKDCKTNDIFFSIQGNKLKGNNYIKDAIKNGSKIVISNLNFLFSLVVYKYVLRFYYESYIRHKIL